MTLNDFINAHGKKLDSISARILAHQTKGHRQGHRWGEARRFAGRRAGNYITWTSSMILKPGITGKWKS